VRTVILPSCRRIVLASLGGFVLLALAGPPTEAADKKAKPVAPLPNKESLLTVEDWQKTPLLPLKSEELDQLERVAFICSDGCI
jgi:hypothetical protein